MNRERNRLIMQLLLYLGLAMFAALPVFAQVPVDEDGNPVAPLVDGAEIENFDDDELPTLSAGELEDIVGPVALYPDDLLAIVLPASTYPLQVVQAARFLERLEADPSLKPDEDWDESIIALLNYPEVVELMNEDIDWTWRLGEAVVAQQADVIAAIEAFRDRAYAAGNLKTDDRQTVSNEDGVIEIEPTNEDVIYVPYYEPERVVVYQPRPVYYYYPRAYPVYYYPYPYGYSFSSGYFWGVTTAFTIGWLTDHLHVYHHSYWGHPYYGYHYNHRHYYRRPSLFHYNHYYVHNSNRYWNYRYRDGDYWRPRREGGARPGHQRERVHYYRDRTRDDWRDRAEGQARQRNNDASWASNRRNADRRVGNASRQASQRNGFASSNNNGITFRPRDAGARADQERRRPRASDDLNRRSQQRTGFAASSRRTTTASNHSSRTTSPRATQVVNRTPRTTFGPANERRTAPARANNSRRQVQASAPRQVVSRPSYQRAQSRSQPTQRTASRNAPARSASRSSASQHSAGPSRQSESRPSRSNSRQSSSRRENRSRQRN